MNRTVFQVPTTQTKLYLVLRMVSIENQKKVNFFNISIPLHGPNRNFTENTQAFFQHDTDSGI